MYPYDFEADLEVKLSTHSLRVDLRVKNRSPRPMPVAPGLHPYFAIPAHTWSTIRTNVAGFEIGSYRLGETLFFPLQRTLELTLADRRLRMTVGGAFLRPSARTVVWSDHREYLCLEVWTAGVNGLLHPGERVEIPAGGYSEFILEVAVER